MSESKPRARYTLEFKLEAVRLVKGGQVAAVTAKILGIPKQTPFPVTNHFWPASIFGASRSKQSTPLSR